ncbi:MAG: NAD(P)H-hydrate dehydratase [Mucilaginibacter polytrichastri]|nr:NAD(P)H-hydrate dehydratase [Mucilaginibacter polytrichastri]
MLKVLTSAQMRETDAHTIASGNISSLELMEQAARALTGYFINHFPDKQLPLMVFCGSGNNGGDGLAIARLLRSEGYSRINVIVARFSEKSSDDFRANLERAEDEPFSLVKITRANEAPAIPENAVLIDALLGSGLNKPLTGEWAALVRKMNDSGARIVSVDAPTGFFTEGEIDTSGVLISADLVITFQRPKINFFVPESAPYIKDWQVVDVGLDEHFIQAQDTPFSMIDEKQICHWLKPRQDFEHKGTFGHAFMVAGQAETMGAALLSSEASVLAGAGLTTACIPESGLTALNARMPEIMAYIRKAGELIEPKWDKFTAIGIGPGLGTDEPAQHLLHEVLRKVQAPVLLDADALNILASENAWRKRLPQHSVLTPHVKEFDRLFGDHKSWWQRLETGRKEAQALKSVIVLKNRYTFIFLPDGNTHINLTGNPAMSTGGMGDVLSGIITALLAQKYTPEKAAVLGVYLHGKAGDDCAFQRPKHMVLPGEVSRQIPFAMARLAQKKSDRT